MKNIIKKINISLSGSKKISFSSLQRMLLSGLTRQSLLLLLLLSLFSCNNFFENTNLERTQETTTSSYNTYLIIEPDSVKIGGRSVRPDIDAALSKLKSITLKGQKSGGTNRTLATTSDSQTIKDLYNKQILLEDGAGTYTFELQGNIDSVYFYQKITGVVIEESKTNVIAFDNLTPVKSSSDYTAFDNYGGFDIKLNLVYQNSGTIINKTVKTLTQLKRADGGALDTYEPIETTVYSNPTSIEYKRWASYSATNSEGCLPVGTYRVTFDFYWKEKTDPVEYQLLNTLSYIVNVSHGLNSIFEDTVDINEVYSISYNPCHDITGHGLSNGLSAGQIQVSKYSRKSQNIILPRWYRAHALFLGWFTQMYGGERVTNIPTGSSQNYELYAHWQAIEEKTGAPLTMYVTPTSLYSYGCSEELGLKNLTEANKTIKEAMSYYDPNTTIKLKGVIEESGQSLNGPSYLNGCATSIILEGSTPTAEGYDPADGINPGLTTATENGVALSINTTVPVTLSNLKITGGNNSNTADETVRGGGLYISSTSDVILEDVLILSNDAATAGKGIYNEGSLKIKGSTKVDGDIYLAAGTTLTIAGELTSTADTIATITPANYSTETTVLAVESGSGVTLDSTLCSKFAVTPQVVEGVTTNWTIDTTGKLAIQTSGGGGDPSTWTGSADGHDYVDLGLPSGTLWATMNVGATLENRYYGDYFAWGETEPRYTSYTISRTDNGYGGISENISVSWKSGYEDNGYSWDNYFDGTNGENFTIFKDADSSELDATHDAATVNWGANWKTPTKDQCSELINKCFMTSTNDYNNTGIAGIIVYKATAGDEGKDTFGSTPPELAGTYSLSTPHIFFPLCGRFPQNNYVSSNDLCAYLWSSTLEPSYPETAYQFSPFNTESYDPVEFDPRANGEPIRPVYVGSTGGNSGNTNSIPDDFVLVTGAEIDFNIGYGVFRSCEDYPITIRNLYVCNHEVTQKEYEQYCIYGTDKDDEGNLGTQFEPTEAHGKGDNFPAYFVSWHDAIVYCNLRSLDEHLTPVYSLPKPKIDPNDPDEALVYSTKPSEWVDIVTSGDKYCGPNLNYYYDISSNYWSNWEWISASPGYESVRIDENANGYRLPTTEEWEYFARGGQGLTGSEAEYEHSGAIDDDAIDNVAHHAQYPYGHFDEDSTTFECGKDVNPNSLGLYDLCGNVKEWCFDLVDDDGQRWIIDGVEYDRNAMYTCDRKSTIGFRVVRNAE